MSDTDDRPRPTFAELQDDRRRRVRRASWSTRSSRRRRGMLAELRAALAAGNAERVPPRRAFAQVEQPHLRRADARPRWRATSSSTGLDAGRRRDAALDALDAEYARAAARAEGAAQWLNAHGPAPPAGRRRQQGQPPAADAQPRAAGPQRRVAPRTAGSRWRCCATRAVRPAAARHRDAGDGRLPGARAARRRPAAARPAGDRDLVARGPRQRRALHRARRRGLPAQAGQPGAAEGAHRRQPREEAPARPAEGAGAALRDLRGRAGPAAVGLRARRQARSRLGDVLRHPRLHGAGRDRSRPRRRSSCSTPTTR